MQRSIIGNSGGPIIYVLQASGCTVHRAYLHWIANTSAHEDSEAELQTLHLGWVVSRIDRCEEMAMGTSGTFPNAIHGPMRRAALGHGVKSGGTP